MLNILYAPTESYYCLKESHHAAELKSLRWNNYNKPMHSSRSKTIIAISVEIVFFLRTTSENGDCPTFYLEIPLLVRKCPENEKCLVDRYDSGGSCAICTGQASKAVYNSHEYH